MTDRKLQIVMPKYGHNYVVSWKGISRWPFCRLPMLLAVLLSMSQPVQPLYNLSIVLLL